MKPNWEHEQQLRREQMRQRKRQQQGVDRDAAAEEWAVESGELSTSRAPVDASNEADPS